MVVCKTLTLVLELEATLSLDNAFTVLTACNLDTHTVLREVVLVLFGIDGVHTILVHDGVVLEQLTHTVYNLITVCFLCCEVFADSTSGYVKVCQRRNTLHFIWGEWEACRITIEEAHYAWVTAGKAHWVIVVLHSLVIGQEEAKAALHSLKESIVVGIHPTCFARPFFTIAVNSPIHNLIGRTDVCRSSNTVEV